MINSKYLINNNINYCKIHSQYFVGSTTYYMQLKIDNYLTLSNSEFLNSIYKQVFNIQVLSLKSLDDISMHSPKSVVYILYDVWDHN